MDGLLCHCRMNPDGHEPGSVLDCEAPKIAKGSHVSRSGTNGVEVRPGGGAYVAAAGASGLDKIIDRYAVEESFRRQKLDARGTCPDCGKTVRVQRVEVRVTDRPDLHDLHPGVVVAIRPALAAHKVKAGACSGVGKVPAETRYRSIALDKMIRDFGPESVA
jgi:hypothetical protein